MNLDESGIHTDRHRCKGGGLPLKREGTGEKPTTATFICPAVVPFAPPILEEPSIVFANWSCIAGREARFRPADHRSIQSCQGQRLLSISRPTVLQTGTLLHSWRV